MKILVLGDSGLLGQAVTSWAAYANRHDVLGVSTSAFSGPAHQGKLSGQYRHESMRLPDNMESYRKAADQFKPDAVINCAALADLKDCEQDPAKAALLNAELPAKIAEDCRLRNSAFVHVSTDQVFDGQKNESYTEKDVPNPQHIYGKTKLAGEQGTLKAYSQALVLRTNIVGFRDRAEKPTFAEWICESLALSKPMTLFTDYKVSSVYVGDFVQTVFAMLEKKLSGLWHAASHDYVSKYEFGIRLAEKLGYSTENIKSGSLQDLKLNPPRPAFLAMNSEKAEKTLGKKFFGTEETLDAIARDFKLRLKEKSYARS